MLEFFPKNLWVFKVQHIFCVSKGLLLAKSWDFSKYVVVFLQFWAQNSQKYDYWVLGWSFLEFFRTLSFLGLSFLENVKKQACSKCQILTVGVQGVRRHSYCRGWEQKTKGPPHTLGVVSVQVVLSQLKMPNLNCWGPGESIDTHIVGAGNKKDKVTSAYKGPQCP